MAGKNRRITFVISSLAAGGAERVLSIMANYWAAKGWAVTILTLNSSAVTPFYPLDQRVTMMPLGVAGVSTTKTAAIANNWVRLTTLRRTLVATKPDCIIGFGDTTNVLLLVATVGLGLPTIVSERTAPQSHPIGRVWQRLRNLTYPWADGIVVQSEGAKAYFGRAIQAKSRIIPNPVLPPPPAPTPVAVKTQPVVMAMGRFTFEKGFDLLLKAFARVARKHPAWQLKIVGDGPLREEWTALATEVGLAERVIFTGRVQDPFTHLQNADLFVMSSLYEGFPNALCEAMAAGLPVISFDCPSGPREIIRHGMDGLLIPPQDVDALAAAMDQLMGNSSQRQQLATHAPEIIQRFGIDKVMSQWEAAIAAARGEEQ